MDNSTHEVGSAPNHDSAWEARAKIEDSFQKELAAGRMFGPFKKEEVLWHFEFFRTSPLGAVINGDGSLRPINDLSFPHGRQGIPSVNSFVNSAKFPTTWDEFNTVAKFIRELEEPVLLAIFDWEKAYRQIPTAPNQWPYLMVRTFDDEFLLDTRISFGGVAGCGSFGRPADAWKTLMMKEFDVLAIFRWVDDNLFVKSAHSDLEMTDVVRRADQLGVKTNKEKFSPFAEEQKYLGFVWNGQHKTVRLPKDKLEKRIKQIQEFLGQGAKFSYGEVEILAGRLNHVAYALPQLRCYICSLYKWMIEWQDRRSRRPVPADVNEDLHEWLTSLKDFEATRLIANPDPTKVGWVGDASTKFGIGVLIGRKWAQFRLRSAELLAKGLPSNSEKERITRLETIAVRLGLLMLIKLGAQSSKTFIVWTDNSTTKSVILRRKSGDRFVNSEWKIIQKILIRHQINLVAKRVISAENRADALSRGRRDSHRAQDQLIIAVPRDLEELISHVVQ